MVSLRNIAPKTSPDGAIEIDPEAVDRGVRLGAEAELLLYEPSEVEEYGEAAIDDAFERHRHSLALGMKHDPYDHARTLVRQFLSVALKRPTEPGSNAARPRAAQPVAFGPSLDAITARIARAYVKARITNNGEHPALTDDLRQVYRKNFRKIALYLTDKGRANSKLALTWLSDINLSLDDEWLFKGLVPQAGVVSVFGDSRSFKTFLLIHLAVRGALGRHFGGHQCKNPGPFVYVAAEDPKGVEKRLIGYCMAHDIPRSDVRIAIVGVAPNLGTVEGDADALGRAIRAELEAKGYDDPAGIIIDTLNQTLGDAEENGPGMQAFLINAGALAHGFSCAVLAANHVGHTEKDRERGGSQIKGNADTRLQIKRVAEEPTIVDGVKTFEALIHAHKVKNAEDGFSLKATLRQFILGEDADGDDVTTLVVASVEPADEDGAPGAKAGSPAKAREKSNVELMKDAFVAAYAHLAQADAGDGGPRGNLAPARFPWTPSATA